MFLVKLPKCSRTPWRIGSSASKRVARAAAWTPRHSTEQWSTATNTAAGPSPRRVDDALAQIVRATLELGHGVLATSASDRPADHADSVGDRTNQYNAT